MAEHAGTDGVLTFLSIDELSTQPKTALRGVPCHRVTVGIGWKRHRT